MKYHKKAQAHRMDSSWWWMVLVLVIFLWMDNIQELKIRATAEELVVSPMGSISQLMSHWSNLLIAKQDKSQQLQLISTARQELADELAKVARFEELEVENKALKDTLSITDFNQNERQILASPIVSYALPMVAVGKDNGVREGMLVSSVEGVLLGFITNVSAKVSQVTLLSSPQSQLILARTSSEAQGLVKGNNGRVFWEEVPREIEVRKGQRIVTLGQQGIPAGELVGVVGSIETEVTAPVHKILIDQLVDFYQVPMVIIHE